MGFFSKLRPDPRCPHGNTAGACWSCIQGTTPSQGQYRNGRKVGNAAGRVDKRQHGRVRKRPR